mmetsp:Transcript_27407/g.70428  ORF Transcript_27407/g.70428 Transcript_27407/m.70428 type:complete len:305 (+) Transcript_27407:2117-3031(+)
MFSGGGMSAWGLGGVCWPAACRLCAPGAAACEGLKSPWSPLSLPSAVSAPKLRETSAQLVSLSSPSSRHPPTSCPAPLCSCWSSAGCGSGAAFDPGAFLELCLFTVSWLSTGAFSNAWAVLVGAVRPSSPLSKHPPPVCATSSCCCWMEAAPPAAAPAPAVWGCLKSGGIPLLSWPPPASCPVSRSLVHAVAGTMQKSSISSSLSCLLWRWPLPAWAACSCICWTSGRSLPASGDVSKTGRESMLMPRCSAAGLFLALEKSSELLSSPSSQPPPVAKAACLCLVDFGGLGSRPPPPARLALRNG